MRREVIVRSEKRRLPLSKKIENPMKKIENTREVPKLHRGFMIFIAGVIALAAVSCGRSDLRTMRVSGQGLDFYPDSTRVLVFPYGADYRFESPVASAFIVDGAFSLSFHDSITRVYEMAVEEEIFKGSFQIYPFFSDGELLYFSFRRRFETMRVEVSGSPDNEEIYLYRNQWENLYEPIDSITCAIKEWIKAKYGEDRFPEEGSADYIRLGKEFERVSALSDSIFEAADYDGWQNDRIRCHPTLAGLFEISTALEREARIAKNDAGHRIDTTWLNLYNDYHDRYPDSWLVQRTDKLLAAVDRLAPGAPFPDFTAPSLDGERHRLGELIEGQIAVLDCWASWCLRCRRHSIELIPIYEQYRERGFTVVGVAREYDDLDDMQRAIEKDGYPWIQLYDLDGAEGVWDLYGLSSAGGGIFLIDREGRIVEKVSDVAQVRRYLEEQLGK